MFFSMTNIELFMRIYLDLTPSLSKGEGEMNLVRIGLQILLRKIINYWANVYGRLIRRGYFLLLLLHGADHGN
jgi:hypothetical protein